VLAEDLITHLTDQAYDMVGEASEGWLIEVAPGQLTKLENMLANVWQQFMREEKLEPDFWEVSGVGEYTL
jgi:hypothetical protein